MGRDGEREASLNRDAAEMIERLEWEVDQLLRASEGQEERLADAAELARAAASDLGAREGDLSQATEDAARLAARHQSAERLVADNRNALDRLEEESARAADASLAAQEAVAVAIETAEAATEAVQAEAPIGKQAVGARAPGA